MKVAEISIQRAVPPTGIRWPWLHRWYWCITWHRLAEGPYSSVYDRRVHLYSDGGWALTYWGAGIAVSRALRAAENPQT